MQFAEHPSPETRLPSSHASSAVRSWFPHAAGIVGVPRSTRASVPAAMPPAPPPPPPPPPSGPAVPVFTDAHPRTTARPAETETKLRDRMVLPDITPKRAAPAGYRRT